MTGSAVRRRAAVLVIAVLAALASSAPAEAQVSFSEPLGSTGSKLHAPAETTQFPLAPHGYTEQEYLVSGTANGNAAGYHQRGSYPDLPFTTRIIVRHPVNAKKSNGTVVLEWMNVSLQQDTDVDWIESYRQILHDGFTYVGVSVQPTGVPLSAQDPVRYGQVHIPPYAPNADTASPDQGGPAYGESIFAQVAHALKSSDGAQVLGGRAAKRIIATGESQSAGRLSCYLLDAKPTDPVFDAFIIDHGECAGPTAGASTPFAYAPTVPTMFLDGMYESRPAMHDGPNMRVWQIAGASHVDAWIGAYGAAEHNWDDTGTPQSYSEESAGDWGLEGGQGGVCNLFNGPADPVRADQLPQQYVHDTAIAALQTWMTTGKAAPAAPPLKFDPNGGAAQDGAGGGVATDQFGNPLGGLRLPQIQMPVARYQGTCPQQGQGLIGTTVPFTGAQLVKLYPKFAQYRAKMCRASRADVRQGVLLKPDAKDIDRRVRLQRGRWPEAAQGNRGSGRACAWLTRTAARHD